jgi:polyisoprenoid-binding protein YceI
MMKSKTRILILMPLLLAAIGSVSASAQIYTVKDGSVYFYSKAPIEDIEASTINVQSILNTQTKEVAFIVPIRGFQFRKDLMREHFNEKYMESDKYPNAAFSGKVKEDIAWTKDGTYPATVEGSLKIHGVKKDKTYTGTVTVKGEQISVETNFPVAIKEFDITIPKVVFQNVADTIRVKLNVNFQPYKK